MLLSSYEPLRDLSCSDWPGKGPSPSRSETPTQLSGESHEQMKGTGHTSSSDQLNNVSLRGLAARTTGHRRRQIKIKLCILLIGY